MRNFVRKLMYGRYGIDQFSSTLITGGMILLLMHSIFRIRLFYLVGYVFLIYALFRTFSKNFSRRQKENQTYLKFYTNWLRISKKYWRRLKDLPHYRYYKCLNCKQTIRVPRGKGRVEIRCPKCGYSFRSKT